VDKSVQYRRPVTSVPLVPGHDLHVVAQATLMTIGITSRCVHTRHRFSIESSMFWSGVLTLHEVDGRHILKNVAIQKRNGAVFTGEFALTQ